MKISVNLFYPDHSEVKQVYVSHLISTRRMAAKGQSNQPTARLIVMHAGTACVMLALDEINQK